MLQGAILGAVVGTIMALIMWSKASKRKKAVLETLKTEGRAAARSKLDGLVKPIGMIPMSKLVAQRDRMASLAIIGDVQALEQEVAAHTGKLTALVQVNAMGLLGLAVRSDNPAPHAAALVALADKMEAEGGRLMKLVKSKTRTLAGLAQAIAGTPIEHKVLADGRAMASNEMGTVKILILQALAQAIEGTGGDGGPMRAEVQKFTDAFETNAPVPTAQVVQR